MIEAVNICRSSWWTLRVQDLFSIFPEQNNHSIPVIDQNRDKIFVRPPRHDFKKGEKSEFWLASRYCQNMHRNTHCNGQDNAHLHLATVSIMWSCFTGTDKNPNLISALFIHQTDTAKAWSFWQFNWFWDNLQNIVLNFTDSAYPRKLRVINYNL